MNEASELFDANSVLEEFILDSSLSSVGRLGSVELEVVNFFYNLEKESLNKSVWRLRKEAWITAGIFPPIGRQMQSFSTEYVSAMSHANIVAQWPSEVLKVQESFMKEFCSDARRIPLASLDPIYLASLNLQPWTLKLKDLNVLVISTFADEIESQYLIFKHLHTVPILPDFNLSVLKPPVTNGITFTSGNWDYNLEKFKKKLCNRVETKKFDIALVSAGSYGMPICNILQSLGIKSIYMGGALQILFGIMGNRWSNSSAVQAIMTDKWKRPNSNSKPMGYRFIDRSSYW